VTIEADNRKSTLVFAVNVQHIQSLVEVFRRAGIDARGVHGKTPGHERRATLEAFRKQEFPVLVNCALVTEGVDIPPIDCLMMARPTRSDVLLQQMLGRGMRIHPGKLCYT
jgi:superfamily II DNA or RNA helicase